jgi:hypothetical protein
LTKGRERGREVLSDAQAIKPLAANATSMATECKTLSAQVRERFDHPDHDSSTTTSMASIVSPSTDFVRVKHDS